MKKMTLLLLLCTTLMTAQKKEVVYKKIATATCECASKKKGMSETELGICIFEAIDHLTDKEKKTINYNPDNKTASIQPIAESIGFEMALICPEVLTSFDKEGSNEDGLQQATVTDAAASVSEIGILEAINTNEFIKLVLLNDKKEKKEFIWLFPFEGDSLLIKKKIAKGDKLEIMYIMTQFYNPKTNNYETYNEITGIKLL